LETIFFTCFFTLLPFHSPCVIFSATLEAISLIDFGFAVFFISNLHPNKPFRSLFFGAAIPYQEESP